MIRKDYMINGSTTGADDADKVNDLMKKEIMQVIDQAFSQGAVVELKIIEGLDLNNDSKRFSKLRLDITSNTDFDQFGN